MIGKIRAYIFIGISFGVFTYILLFSKSVLKWGTKGFLLLNKIFITPIIHVLSIISNILSKLHLKTFFIKLSQKVKISTKLSKKNTLKKDFK